MTTVTLKDIINELSSVSHDKWRMIGTQIGVLRYKLNEFEGKVDPLS